MKGMHTLPTRSCVGATPIHGDISHISSTLGYYRSKTKLPFTGADILSRADIGMEVLVKGICFSH